MLDKPRARHQSRSAMQWLGAFLIMLLSVQWAGAAESRFAIIKFEGVIRELASSKVLSTTIKTETQAVANDPRAKRLAELVVEMKALLAEARTKAKDADEATRKEFNRKIEALRSETEATRRDYQEFADSEKKRIKAELLAETAVIEKRVWDAAAKIAAERGYDCLFEASGFSNSSMPVLIYAKNPADITKDVTAAVIAEETAAGIKPPPDAPPAAKDAAPAKKNP